MIFKQSDVGHFNSVQDARTYQRAMSFKKNFEGLAQDVVKFDDKVDIDFNNPAKGDVLFQNELLEHSNKYRSGPFNGRVIYNPEDNGLIQVELNSKNSDSDCTIQGTYTYHEENNKQIYEMVETEGWNGSILRNVSSETAHKKLVVDKNTGDIEYSE